MYVYFVIAQMKPEWMMKVGKAKDPARRLAELQIGSPARLTMLAVVRCKSDKHAEGTEKRCHKIFARERSHGEWFRYSRRVKWFLKTCDESGNVEWCENDGEPTELDAEFAAIMG